MEEWRLNICAHRFTLRSWLLQHRILCWWMKMHENNWWISIAAVGLSLYSSLSLEFHHINRGLWYRRRAPTNNFACGDFKIFWPSIDPLIHSINTLYDRHSLPPPSSNTPAVVMHALWSSFTVAADTKDTSNDAVHFSHLAANNHLVNNSWTHSSSSSAEDQQNSCHHNRLR